MNKQDNVITLLILYVVGLNPKMFKKEDYDLQCIRIALSDYLRDEDYRHNLSRVKAIKYIRNLASVELAVDIPEGVCQNTRDWIHCNSKTNYMSLATAAEWYDIFKANS